ncbi:MAG: chromate transporter [Alkalilacustris sp.]
MDHDTRPGSSAPGTPAEVFGTFLKLGLTSFGGPIAHLGYFRDELVTRRRWLDDARYADLVALCQFLPGPASSQVGFALGLMRAGWLGALAAFVGFTLPSALVLVAFALTAASIVGPVGEGALTGLKIVAVAIIAQAVIGMARSLCPDPARASIAVGAVVVLAAFPGASGMVGAILLGAVAGLALGRRGARPIGPVAGGSASGSASGSPIGLGGGLDGGLGGGTADGTSATATAGASAGPAGRAAAGATRDALAMPVTRGTALASLGAFAALLLLLPVAAGLGQGWAVLDSFYRAGALVFGGGHVVLPLLQAETVAPGWVSPDAFLAGYGAAQAVPGPLFTFAAYLGAVLGPVPNGLAGAALALGAIFLPGFLLLVGVLPFWEHFRSMAFAQSLMRGANAAVVGILGAALYDPVFTGAIGDLRDLALALGCFVLLMAWKTPPWVVVLVAGTGGVLLALLP